MGHRATLVLRRALSIALVLMVGCGPDASSDAGIDAAMDARRCTSDDECDDGVFCDGIERCTDGVCTLEPSCPADALCDEAGARCLLGCANADGDGDGVRAVECGGLDCDDTDPDRAPGLVELCDGSMHDEDCDPTTYGFRDLDGDDFVDDACCNVDDVSGATTCGNDCDDMRRGVGPNVPEVCNMIDDDCDGAIDEGLVTTVYRDDDFDGHGIALDMAGDDDIRVVCSVEPGWSRIADDCNDAQPDEFPGNPEVCDDLMLDEDCSGAPNDPPGGCVCTGSGSEACGTLGVCAGARRQCESGTWSPCERVPGTEVCDGSLDEDCDGMVDESLTVRCYLDADRDGYARDGAMPVQLCPSSDPGRAAAPWNGCPIDYTARTPAAGALDCCDSDARARPSATAFQTVRSACGAWDYDCDGDEELELPPDLATCGGSSCTGDRGGWDTSRAPLPTRCGDRGWYVQWCGMVGGTCYGQFTGYRVMGCR